ncbi:MAG: GNAT family N-acetyltransferase [Anaerolineae bacterium]|nr:GNAT family N-acetyltransferase [Anaerolineae bacterium]
MVNIRKANIKDSTGLAKVQVDSYRRAYAGIFPQSYLDHFTYEEEGQDWRDLLSSETEDILYVAATDTGEIVGYALGRPGPSDIPPYDSELVALHVHHSYQRQSIGKQLIAAIAKQLQQKGCTSLMLWTLEKNLVRSMYERLGGQAIGVKDWGGNEEFGIEVKEVAYGWLNIENLITATE